MDCFFFDNFEKKFNCWYYLELSSEVFYFNYIVVNVVGHIFVIYINHKLTYFSHQALAKSVPGVYIDTIFKVVVDLHTFISILTTHLHQ